jgi:PAS domain S-box-containing protein
MNGNSSPLGKVSLRQVRAWLVLGLILVNLFVIVLAAYSLAHSKQLHEARTALLTHNLVGAIEQSVADSVMRADLVLRMVVDELEHELAAGRIDERRMRAVLARHQENVPELEAIRIADAAGQVFMGKGVDPARRASWADREYFIALRDNPQAGMLVSKPRVGRVARRPIIGFARRYNHPDGRFAGVVSAPIAIEHFSALLGRFDAGPNGSLILRDADFGLIVRHPPQPNKPAGTLGNNDVSAELRAMMAAHPDGDTYHTLRGASGLERIASYRRVGNAPMLVVAAISPEDYLAAWRDEVLKTLGVMLGFVLVSILSASFLWRLLNRFVRENHRSERILQYASDGILVIDKDGRVVEANDRFCAMLGRDHTDVVGQRLDRLDANLDMGHIRMGHDELGADRGTDSFVESGGRTLTFEHCLRAQDGTTLDVEINAALFRMDGQRYIHASLRDISERNRHEMTLQRQKTLFQHLNRIAALSHLPLHEQFQHALAIGAEHLGLEFGIVSHIEGDDYEVVAQVSPPDTLKDGQHFTFGVTYCHITLGQEGVVAIAHMGESEHLGHPCYQAFKLESYIGAPLRVEGRVYGTVNFSSPHPYPRSFDDVDREFVAQLALWAGSAIERDRTMRRIADSELELKTIVENEPECVKLLTPDGILLRMNRAGLDMIEADTEAQVVGRPIVEVIAPEHQAEFVALNERVRQGGSGVLAYETIGLKGGRRWLETHAVPLRDASGGIVGLLSVTRDISARKAADRALVAAKQAAEAANLAKSQFLATMSHEIRTPMNGILGMAQLLLLPDLSATERLDYTRTILASGQTLLAILNDILDLSKIDAGRMELAPVAFDPVPLIEEVAALFGEAAHAKGLHLAATWRGPAGKRYRGDPIRLRQMLSNLISNAIKFTEQGEVHISVDERVIADGTVELVFAVRDSGIGLSAEDREKLFLPFSQVDASASRRFGGTGLGLSIIRRLAMLMGGDVAVESTPGVGSTFSFHVRVQALGADEDSRAMPRDDVITPAPVGAAAGGLRILVAEDNRTNRVVIEALLRKCGYEFRAVEDGQAAVETVTEGRWRPDLVLMDCQMPTLSGFDATRRIRDWEASQGAGYARLPIIALTAGAFEDDRSQCFAAGMDDFLTKPVELALLTATLRKWLAPLAAESAAESGVTAETAADQA